ncbi:hypothetical protein H632_c101p0, partial [Helicosporidium sp. ATCC 50920]
MPGILDGREIGGFQHWFHIRRWPIILVTGGTIASLAYFSWRKGEKDPSLLYEPQARMGGLAEASRHEDDQVKMAQDNYDHSFGRRSADRAGLMKGDRPLQ